jgi:hypothetical protein
MHDPSNEEDLDCYRRSESSRDLKTQSGHPESNVQGVSPTATKGVNQPDGVTQTTEHTSNDRPHRAMKRPGYLKDCYCTANVDYTCAVIPTMPENYEQATNSADAERWKAAMNVEIDTLIENYAWEIVPLPDNRTETKRKMGVHDEKKQTGR